MSTSGEQRKVWRKDNKADEVYSEHEFEVPQATTSKLLAIGFADQGNWHHRQIEDGQCLIRR